MIKQERSQAKYMLLLDAGDGLIRDRAPATESEGKTSIALMNMMAYDAMALGEGDLAALGPDTVGQRMAEADFPILSANVFLAETGKLLAQPYAVFDFADHRVGVIGLTGQATIPGVEIRPAIDAARTYVRELGGKVDLLILLSHAGLKVNRQIADQVGDVDLIISGGTDGFTATPEVTEGGPVIVHADTSSAGHAGRNIGVGTWYLNGHGRSSGHNWNRVPLTPSFTGDPEMEAWVQEHR